MCLNGTYPFLSASLSGNCHIICFVKPVLWTATRSPVFLYEIDYSSCFNRREYPFPYCTHRDTRLRVAEEMSDWAMT